jgi:3-hydroxybutyryl-CoA dehydrogenase
MSPPEIRRVGVVGLGAMGAGIAQLAVEAGFETVGREVTEELGAKAHERIGHFLQRKVDKEQMSAADRESTLASLSLTTDLADLAGCDLVIEAIVEDLDAKLELFRELEGVVRPDAILATNTSALSVTEIAAAVSTPERVVGMHFFNPAPLMPLVEIVRAELSSDVAVAAAFAVGERMGKRPIRCHDTPGFVVNRVLIPLLNDCIRVLDEARMTPEDLDTAMTAGAGWPMHARRPRRHRRPRARLRGAVREAARAAHGSSAAHRRDEERGPPRPEERPRLLRVRVTRQDGASSRARHSPATESIPTKRVPSTTGSASSPECMSRSAA